jgi:hypothetical protein
MVYYNDGRGDAGEGQRKSDQPQEGKPPEEGVEEFLRRLAGGILKDKKTQLKEAVARSRRIRRAEQTLGTPGSESGIVERHEGLLRRANPQDSASLDAAKANHDDAVLLYEVKRYLAKLIYSGKVIGMELHDGLSQLDDEYSESAVPYGELMTEWGMEKYLDSYKEVLDMYPAMRVEHIAQVMVRRYISRS